RTIARPEAGRRPAANVGPSATRCEGLHAPQTFGDILPRGGVRKPDVLLPLVLKGRAEGASGQYGHAGVLKQPLLQGFRVGQAQPGIAFRPATIMSLRARNSSTIASDGCCGPVSAAIPAYWVKVAVHDSQLVTSRATASAKNSGITPYPSLQPVMA